VGSVGSGQGQSSEDGLVAPKWRCLKRISLLDMAEDAPFALYKCV
jgi:hypothetical protein